MKKLTKNMDEFRKYLTQNNLYATFIFTIDIIFYFLTLTISISSNNIFICLLFSFLNGLAIGLLFLVGHDCCHQAFFSNSKLNLLLGRLAFAPSMTNFTLWNVEHNQNHHGFTNYSKIDNAWVPKTIDQYKSSSMLAKYNYRLHRHPLGHGLHWLVEIWFRLVFVVKKKHRKLNKDVQQNAHLDFVFNILFWLTISIAFVALQKSTTNTFSLIKFSIVGLIIPWSIWCWLAGFITFVHHTHFKVQWFDDYHMWKRSQAAITSTTEHIAPRAVGVFFHRILTHNVHHFNPKIPLYKVQQAQNTLKYLMNLNDVIMPEVQFGLKNLANEVYSCKLYDFTSNTWISYYPGSKKHD